VELHLCSPYTPSWLLPLPKPGTHLKKNDKDKGNRKSKDKVHPRIGNEGPEGSRSIDLLFVKPLNAKLNPICHLLALFGVHHFLHVRWIMV
jgi:hypothetical protein